MGTFFQGGPEEVFPGGGVIESTHHLTEVKTIHPSVVFVYHLNLLQTVLDATPSLENKINTERETNIYF